MTTGELAAPAAAETAGAAAADMARAAGGRGAMNCTLADHKLILLHFHDIVVPLADLAHHWGTRWAAGAGVRPAYAGQDSGLAEQAILSAKLALRDQVIDLVRRGDEQAETSRNRRALDAAARRVNGLVRELNGAVLPGMTWQAHAQFGGALTDTLKFLAAACSKEAQNICMRVDNDSAATYLEDASQSLAKAAQALARVRDAVSARLSLTEASVDQYVAWLAGYVEHGGAITGHYSFPFKEGDFMYARNQTAIDSDNEYGAYSRHIIVAPGVEVSRTDPAGDFGGFAHTNCYWMTGYRTNNPDDVALYSDREFDVFRNGK